MVDMKKLSTLLKALHSYKIYGKDSISVTGVVDDSRNVKKGSIFVAIQGLSVDGYKFIGKAIKNGASVVVGSREPNKEWIGKITYVKVSEPRTSLGLLVSKWYKDPSKKMKIIGVTGTDGKTTTVSILYHILRTAGERAGMINSISARMGDCEYNTGFHVTTPDAVDLHPLLAKMLAGGCKYVILEVTSHGLDQGRVSGVDFDAAVLTNLTHEHLDYHSSREEYKKAKAKLFESTKNFVVLNKDDESFDYFYSIGKKNLKRISYSVDSKKANIQAKNIKTSNGSSLFDVVSSNMKMTLASGLGGKYNISNCLAAIAVARQYQISDDAIKNALASFKTVTGRLEEIENKRGFKIYIDFAHTPNSLNNVLSHLRKQAEGRLISVISCTGKRDVQKRPIMADIATRLSDYCVFTEDDPRYEKVDDIFDQMAEGVDEKIAIEMKPSDFDKAGNHSKHIYFRIEDRGEAIAFAIQSLAQKGDIVGICGKGHEKAMAIEDIEYPWSEHEAVKAALKGTVKRVEKK